jgi:hypothetical protein
MGYAAPYEIFRQGNEGENSGGPSNKAGNVCEDGNVWGFSTGIAKGL